MIADLFGPGNPIPYLGFAVLVGYGLGSVPYGLLFSKLFLGIDPRHTGSGNIGATNVLRTGSKTVALFTLLCDGGKGALAVWVMGSLWGPQAEICAAAGAMVGHIYPIWLKGRGGKGVATAFGCFLAIDPLGGLVSMAIWLLTALIFRYSSLAALVAMISAPIYASVFGTLEFLQISIIIAVFVWSRHIANIHRLIKGEESRINLKKSN